MRQRMLWSLRTGGCWSAAGACAAARANDMGLFAHNRRLDILGNVMTIVYSPIVWVVEAMVLSRMLRLGYWWSLLAAGVANSASTAVSFVLYFGGVPGFRGTGEGWKRAWIYGQWDQVGLLLARSFLITASVEAVVAVLILRKRAEAPRVIGAVVAANGVSYALTMVMIAVMMRIP